MNRAPSQDEADAKEFLEANGWTVIRTKSYRAAQERLRVAEARRVSEEMHAEQTREWAQRAYTEQRALMKRCEFLYGMARSYGATAEELRGES